jgi:Na+-driven multidrug efflux pump
MRIEALIFMPLMALSLAVSSIVGQNLGAGQSSRAVNVGWRVTIIGIAMMIVMGVLLFAFAQPLAQVMSKDPVTLIYTRQYLQINAFSEPFLALSMILSGALQGAGDTRTPMWITIFTNWVMRLPLAWVLAVNFHFGPCGVWLAMAFSVVISAILTLWRFQSRRWLQTKV